MDQVWTQENVLLFTLTLLKVQGGDQVPGVVVVVEYVHSRIQLRLSIEEKKKRKKKNSTARATRTFDFLKLPRAVVEEEFMRKVLEHGGSSTSYSCPFLAASS